MAQKPRGTVTFLFTDVEGSTRLLKELRDEYGAVLAEHQRLLRDAFAARGGEEVDTQGDAFFYVFSRARDAAAAAADGQRALAAHDWPEDAELRVRMGMHTGEPVLSDEGRYHGMGVHRAARIMAAGHGGQILASQSTASVLADDDLDGISLRDLGEHKLKDLARPERIYELQVERLQQDFAPLKTEGVVVVPTRLYRRPVVLGAAAGVAAAAIAIPVFAFGGDSGESALTTLAGNSVGIVDATSGSIDDEVSDVPAPTRVAAGANGIWVTSSDTNTVSRIDADSHELRDTLRVGDGPTGIAFGAGDVWVANTRAGTVSRIDPEANEVVGDPIRVGNSPTAIGFGEGSVWVTNVDDQSVSRIDPQQGVVEETIDVGAAGRGITVGSGAIWVGDIAENRVVRLDPKTSGVTQAINVGSGPGSIAFGGGAVWVANTLDGTVSRIDPATNQVRATVPVGASPDALAAGDDEVWVANEADRTIVRLDPGTGNVAQTVRIAARPTGLALAGSLWVAAQASAGTHRGKTLVVEQQPLPEKTIDPATAYIPPTWRLLNITNDGLVGFKHVGGSGGTQLVPNLATSLPTPTDARKTYAFQLREGIRFSNGSLLKASDVRSTFERLFKAGTPAPHFYASIRGGSACSKRPKACTLSEGIVTDDEARTVTFQLTRPDPEFLYKLAIPFGSIVPAGTPVSKDGTRPVPATGPYVTRSATPKRLILVRNRHFRVWNAVAQPDGYVDRIEVSLGSKPARAAIEVARGAADVVSSGFVAAFGTGLTKFETQHPAQVHTTPASGTSFWFLNTRVPPFADARARQAVSYAVDRAELVRILGGPDAAQPTCQLLPPNFPGYRRHCPFTAAASAGGAWSGPDLVKARELVRQSGTAGARVVFWGSSAPQDMSQLDLARSLLTRLGYRVSVKVFPRKAYLSALDDAPANTPQAGFSGWAADYPAASNFFVLVSCSSLGHRRLNASGFCSHELEAKIKHATALQAEDQVAAAKLWAEVDRETTNLAALVPTFTPRNIDLVSKRVGNYQYHPLFGVLLDQLWVR